MAAGPIDPGVRLPMLGAIIGAVLQAAPAAGQPGHAPERFQGHWASDPSQCMSMHEGALSITADEFLFPESRAGIVSVRQTGELEAEFELEFSGEGQSWRDRRRFVLSADAATLTDVTAPARLTRVRCLHHPLPYVDEAANDAGFHAFRCRLLDAVARRDAAYVLSIVSADIRNSFGGGGGIEEFTARWRPGAGDSRFWDEFGTVLRLGGAFDGGDRFVAPYTFATWPDTLDAFGHAAVIGNNVNVREKPMLAAPVIAQMSYRTVPLAGSLSPGEWRHVRISEAITGYMHARYLRSPVDYRAFFERRGGEWKLTMFIAGD